MTWLAHVTVAAVVQRDDQFLLVEEQPVKNSNKLVLNQPAGHLEDNESLIEAVKRETFEETGWEFNPDAIVGIYRFRQHDGAKTYIRVAFSGELVRQVHLTPPDADIKRVVWMTRNELQLAPDRIRSPQVLATIDDFLAGERYPMSLLREI